MNIMIEDLGKAVVINLEGEMMLGYEASDFHEAVRNSIDDDKKKIIVDLKNVKFISSWGIGILIYGYTTTMNAGGKFELASVPNNVKEVIKKVKLDSIFPQFASVEEALAVI